MTNKIIALLGVSGVGKSTALKTVGSTVSIQHLQASEIIKNRRQKLENEALSNEDLCGFSINDNQQLLIQGFKDALKPSPTLAILDGHSAIETPNGVVLIEPTFFASVGVRHLIFLADFPGAIARRRNSDQLRQRPSASEQEIEALQNTALVQAALIVRHLDINMTLLRPSHADQLAKLLSSIT